MNTIQILKQLISTPSWVDEKTNEKEIGNWVKNYLKKNSNLKVVKQNLGNGKLNIIARNSNRFDILVTGHIDTVQPNAGWTKNPIKPEIASDRLYGLGASDMKCGVAIMLSSASNPKLKENTMFLFYCDEEYDFLGMKKFIEEYKGKIKPKLIISLDGEGLQIGNSCRGLVEIKVIVEGKTGHAARPKSGINAITESQKVIERLRIWLNRFSTKELGNSTLNIAYFNGGTKVGTESDKVILGKEGNIIPDYCEYIVEIRVASEKLNANLVKDLIEKESKKLGLKVNETKIRHDLGSWITPKGQLKNYIKLASNKNLKNAKESGYIDIQMLWKTFGKIPTFSLGAGETGMSHKPDEFVRISNVLKAQKFFKSILTNK